MSRYDTLIELKRKRRESSKNKRRVDGLREYLRYRRGEEPAEETEAPPRRVAKTKPINQPENWSFLDE